MTAGVVVVGGSLAGMTAVDALIECEYPGPITVLEEESGVPYARPPLSKGVLKGADTIESIAMPAQEHRNLSTRRGVRATGLDTATRTVHTSGGGEVLYDQLIIATGSAARRFDAVPNQMVLRTLDDALRIRDRLATVRSAIVVGGGFLGAEVASAARKVGVDVTIIDHATPFVHSLGHYLGGLMLDAAIAAGVRIEVWPDGVDIEVDGDEAIGVRRADGTSIRADLVVTAIGDAPTTSWLRDSGVELSTDGWVLVDPYCRAYVGGRVSGSVFAAGDVTSSASLGPRNRLPHWENAIGQARSAVGTLVAGPTRPYVPQPYFWTEAFGMELKIAGGPLPVAGQPTVVRGDIRDGSALLTWHGGSTDGATVVVALNFRIPVKKIRSMVSPAAR
ncbi:NAD(P)/FAD-dependent oxidoreductase [Tsukamurella soli]|uniref:FAD-dependent oxidoreductase n=1 Tax=Tsukamurella soli TaxID=644556 RepID=A0ABP8K9F8_9ACTN